MSSPEKAHVAKPPVQAAEAKGPFFRKAGGEGFFGSKEAQPFFTPAIRPKLEVSQPDDPQEKEADAVADSVVRMADAAPADPGEKREDGVQRSAMDAGVLRAAETAGKEEDKEPAGAAMAQRSAIHRKVQRQAGMGGFASDIQSEESGGAVQAKAQGDRIASFLARSARGPPGDAASSGDSSQHPAATRESPSGSRGTECDSACPAGFDSALASTKGSGTPLPTDTRQSMESRFGADFNGVRIHTGSAAESLSAQISAHAFTHGGDIYFNSGKYNPSSTAGAHLLAHELTHTIQQGSSRPVAQAKRADVARKPIAPGPSPLARRIHRSGVHRKIQRVEAGTQRNAAVELAKAEVGKVSSKETGPDGNRMGWERLLEFFKTTFGKDKILPEGAAYQQGYVSEGSIKKPGTFKGDVKGADGLETLHNQDRDVLPSWCGIFAFWALNKGGIPLKKWQLGQSFIPPEAAYPPSHQPQPGDIAWRREFSHYALVASSDGTSVTSVNGNTSGDDNVGGQIQVQTHPREHWYAFFDPTVIMEGSLRAPNSPELPSAAPARSLRELRKQLFKVDRRAEGGVPAIAGSSDQAMGGGSGSIGVPAAVSATGTTVATGAVAVGTGRADLARRAGGRDTEERKDPEDKVQAKMETLAGPLAAVSGEGDRAGAGSDGSGTGTGAGAGSSSGTATGAGSGTASSTGTGAGKGTVSLHEGPTALFRFADGVSRSAADSETAAPTAGDALSREDIPAGIAGVAQRQPMSLHNRGPPRAPPNVQARISRRIQRWSLSGAWDAVTGAISEAAAWVERGLDRAKEWMLGKVRDFVVHIPGYRMLCLILGEDPITGAAAPMTGANLLEAGLDVLPGGWMFRSLFIRLGIYNDAAQWLQGRIEDLGSTAAGIIDRFARFWDGLSLSDIGDPDGVLERVANLLRSTIDDIVGFVERSASSLLDMIKRVMVREIANFVRTRIPRLYPLLCVALGFDPQTMQDVPRNGTNILNAFLAFSENGDEERKQMLQSGTFQRAAAFIDRGIHVFTSAYAQLKAAIAGIWNFVTIDNLFSPIQTFERIYATFASPIRMVTDYVVDVAKEILKLVKDAILGRLSAFARQTRGYPLLCVIIGRDPFTGTPVPFTVHNVVKGFMSLMEGGEEQYEQLRSSGAIDRIVAKVEAAVARLNMTPRAIIQLFIDLWNSFSIRDLAHPIDCFRRIVATFGEPILRLIRFVIEIVLIVIEAVLILMSFPFDIVSNILAKARQAWTMIRNDPAGFFKNLLASIKLGFVQFFDNIGTHLLNGVVGWLMGELRDAGVPVLTDFSLQGVISWVLQVLGISMEKIWEKLAAHPRIGPEKVARIRRVIDTLEGIWTFIKDVQERGMAAIWDKIQEQLSNLWNTVLDAVKNWIMERIIGAVVTKLLSMLDPTGIMAVVNSCIAIYRAVQSFIRYVTEMLRVVNSFVEGVVQIAEGNIKVGADFLERSLDRAMPIVIGFLANQVGLGGIGSRIAEMIERAREMVDQALTWLVNRAVDTGFALIERAISLGRSAVGAIRDWWRGRKEFRAPDGEQHALYVSGSGASARLMIASTPKTYSEFIGGLTVDASKQSDKNQAIQVAGRLDQAILNAASSGAAGAGASAAGSGGAAGAGGGAAADPAAAIQALLEELGGITARIMPGHGAGAATPPIYGPTTGTGFGTSATVSRLRGSTPIPGGGSPSSSTESNPAWQKLRRRMDGGGTYYVRGHLLNDNLGGPGNTWSNLTPLTQNANNRDSASHLHGFETPVKNAVDAGKTVNFQVTAQYGRASRSGEITFLRNQGNPDDDTIADILEAEERIPTVLDCRAYEVDTAGANGPAVAVHTVQNHVETALADYSLSPVRKVDVYLNEMTLADLKGLNGIGDALADAIVAGRPFRTRRQLQEAAHIADGRWNQMQSTPGKRVRIYRQ